MTTANTAMKGTALSAVLLLTLAACDDNGDSEATGNGNDNGENGDNSTTEEETGPVVYDFTGGSVGDEEEIRFEIPEELIELTGQAQDVGYVDTRAVEAVTVRAAEGQDCVIEMEYEFDGRAVSELEGNTWEWITNHAEMEDAAYQEPDAQEDESVEIETEEYSIEEKYAFTVGDYDGDYEQLSETTYQADLSCAASHNDNASTATVLFSMLNWREDVDQDQGLGFDDALVQDALPEEGGNIETGYDDTVLEARVGSFAVAEVNIMADGTISVVDADISDSYTLDANGTWIESH